MNGKVKLSFKGLRKGWRWYIKLFCKMTRLGKIIGLFAFELRDFDFDNARRRTLTARSIDRASGDQI